MVVSTWWKFDDWGAQEVNAKVHSEILDDWESTVLVALHSVVTGLTLRRWGIS
jgi:hypothetical protein